MSTPFLTRRALFSQLLATAVVPSVYAFGQEATLSWNLPSEAEYLLKRGRQFERVATILRKELDTQPNDWHLWASLGCACAGRVASLSYAAGYIFSLAQERDTFDERLKKWKAAQSDEKNYDYWVPKPKLPALRVFPTLDNGRPFTMTQVQVEKAAQQLRNEAKAAWAKAENVAPTPREKAECAYLHGWGLYLLNTYSKLEGPNGGDKELYPPVPASEVKAVFERAINYQPQNPLYHRALGDYVVNIQENPEIWKNPVQEQHYHESLRLEPNQPGLWYWLYNHTSDTVSKNRIVVLPKRLEFLKQAALYDKGNAWPAYEEAALRLRPASFSLLYQYRVTQNKSNVSSVPEGKVQEDVATDESREAAHLAVELVKRGNAKSVCLEPRYHVSVPRYLEVPWRYKQVVPSVAYSTRFRELARALAGCALALSEAGDTPGAVRAAQAIINFGEKVGAKRGRQPDFDPATHVVTEPAFGLAAVTVGYQTLALVHEKAGRTREANQARAAYETAKSEQARFNDKVTQFLQNHDSYSDYGKVLR